MLPLLRNLGRTWLTRQEQSGTASTGQEKEEEAVDVLLAVLDRRREINALDALASALRGDGFESPLGETAIALDSSVFLRLGAHADVIDYLNIAHAAPLVLPGQAVQEFWNNQLQVIDSVSAGVRKKFDALKLETSKVDENFLGYAERFEALLSEFGTSYGYVYDEAVIQRTAALIGVLLNRAITSFAPRSTFSGIAAQRKRTKTPPGFKDEGDGDFFVWVDILLSLLKAKSSDIAFSKVVLVTNDKKLDWSREGVAHPLLAAEMRALVNVPFQIWDIKRLVREVADAT
jgi:hypothetical protein